MPSRPRTRSLPASVYWRRRLVALTVAVLMFVGLGKALSHSSNAQSTVQNSAVVTTPTLTVTPKTTPPTPRHPKGKKAKPVVVAPPAPTLVAPVGQCYDGDIVVTPSVPTAVAGQDVTVVLVLRTVTNPACTWTLDRNSLAVKITSGADFIWSTQQCPAAIEPQSVVVRQAVATQVTLRWDAKRSDATCSAYTHWALPGYYHVAAAALGGNRGDAQFKLVPPSPTTVYVTRTVKPKPTPTGKSSGAVSPSSPTSSSGH